MKIRLRKPINTAAGVNLPIGAELDVPERVARHLIEGRFAEGVPDKKLPRKEAEKPIAGGEEKLSDEVQEQSLDDV